VKAIIGDLSGLVAACFLLAAMIYGAVNKVSLDGQHWLLLISIFFFETAWLYNDSISPKG
jgi:hypothetical protein